jgi:flagellar protein FliT
MSMMTDEQVLAAYELLKQLSQRMLASNRQRDWEQMPQQQEELAALMQALQAGEGEAPRPPAVMAAKKTLIDDILAMQKATMAIALPWRDSVAAMLDSAGSAKRVAQAYGQGG